MAVQLSLVITQHIRGKKLLEGLIGFLDCGILSLRNGKEAADYKVLTLAAITDKIIPFFKKYPIQGAKSLNFADFCLALLIPPPLAFGKGGISGDNERKRLFNSEGLRRSTKN
jgi:hypothetical protein